MVIFPSHTLACILYGAPYALMKACYPKELGSKGCWYENFWKTTEDKDTGDITIECPIHNYAYKFFYKDKYSSETAVKL